MKVHNIFLLTLTLLLVGSTPKKLMASGSANPLATDGQGKTALHRAVEECVDDAIKEKKVKKQLRAVCVFYVELLRMVYEGRTTLTTLANVTKSKSYGTPDIQDRTFIEQLSKNSFPLERIHLEGLKRYLLNRLHELCTDVAHPVASQSRVTDILRAHIYAQLVEDLIKKQFGFQEDSDLISQTSPRIDFYGALFEMDDLNSCDIVQDDADDLGMSTFKDKRKSTRE